MENCEFCKDPIKGEQCKNRICEAITNTDNKATRSPFMIELLDPKAILSINGNDRSRAIYNLIVHKRDFFLFSKGITPHRGWKFTVVKNYYGLSGTRTTILPKFMELFHESMKVMMPNYEEKTQPK